MEISAVLNRKVFRLVWLVGMIARCSGTVLLVYGLTTLVTVNFYDISFPLQDLRVSSWTMLGFWKFVKISIECRLSSLLTADVPSSLTGDNFWMLLALWSSLIVEHELFNFQLREFLPPVASVRYMFSSS